MSRFTATLSYNHAFSPMIYGDELEVRSHEIKLRREKAERELNEARQRQRLRRGSTGSVSSVASSLLSNSRYCANFSSYFYLRL